MALGVGVDNNGATKNAMVSSDGSYYLKEVFTALVNLIDASSILMHCLKPHFGSVGGAHRIKPIDVRCKTIGSAEAVRGTIFHGNHCCVGTPGGICSLFMN